MTAIDLNLDDEILSTKESTPKPPKETPSESKTLSATCHYCPETFDGATAWFQRGAHEKKMHREEWENARAGNTPKPVKKAAKKPTVTKKASGPISGPSAKRIPAADSIARNVARAAKFMSSVDAPLSRALVFSAPATGQAVDELVAGTFVDKKVIQKFAGAADKWERLGGIVAFPVLIAVISKNPALYPMLEDDLRDATLDVIVGSISSLEKQKAREDKAVNALARLGQIDETIRNSTDPVFVIMCSLLGFDPTLNVGGDAPSE